MACQIINKNSVSITLTYYSHWMQMKKKTSRIKQEKILMNAEKMCEFVSLVD